MFWYLTLSFDLSLYLRLRWVPKSFSATWFSTAAQPVNTLSSGKQLQKALAFTAKASATRAVEEKEKPVGLVTSVITSIRIDGDVASNQTLKRSSSLHHRKRQTGRSICFLVYSLTSVFLVDCTKLFSFGGLSSPLCLSWGRCQVVWLGKRNNAIAPLYFFAVSLFPPQKKPPVKIASAQIEKCFSFIWNAVTSAALCSCCLRYF